MNGRNAKMLRRVGRDTRKGKKEFLSFTSLGRAFIREDYINRGKDARAKYSEAKRIAKQEKLSE